MPGIPQLRSEISEILSEPLSCRVWCRVHDALRTTPTVAVGVADRVAIQKTQKTFEHRGAICTFPPVSIKASGRHERRSARGKRWSIHPLIDYRVYSSTRGRTDASTQRPRLQHLLDVGRQVGFKLHVLQPPELTAIHPDPFGDVNHNTPITPTLLWS